MERLRMHTLDGVENNVAKIAALFPNCVTETKDEQGNLQFTVDYDKLKVELGEVVEGPEERYQFTWPGKREAIRLANSPIAASLRPVREDSVDFDNTQNLYIEGDNLDVLKLLRETYLGKVKMIYIDPPYNTGNDFVYEDDFSQEASDYLANSGQYDDQGNRLVANTESNGRFHTDWLNMIYPRLKVARDLLAEDGVVFISIDDRENYNMIKVCNEIFGASSYLTCFSWVNSLKDELDDETKFAGSNLGTIKKSHEYVLVYCKKGYRMPLDASDDPYIIKLVTNGGNAIQRLTVPKGIKCVSNINTVITGHVGGNSDYYDIITPEGMIVENGVLMNDVIIEGPLRNPVMLKGFFKGEKIIDNKGQELIDVFFSESGMLHTKKLRAGSSLSTVLVGKGTTKNGTLLLKEMFGETVFDYAKPIELLKYLLSKHQDNEFIVLDMFSGSGTMAHSVLLSNLDQTKRIKYILVQVQEEINEEKASTPASKKIAASAIKYLDSIGKSHYVTELAKERIKIAARNIIDSHPDIDYLDTGFRVLRLDSSNMEDVYYTPDKFDPSAIQGFIDNVKADRTDEDLLFQVMLEHDIPLSASIKREQIAGKHVFNVAEGHLIATFDHDVNETTVTEIAKQQPNYFVMRDASAANDNVLDNFEQIFRHYSPDTTCKIL